ncbi:unnamed protein product [Caenorhabditis auriculariae]|uniref:Uncharacterized protein n=1 Tax=Caenorhabditis auriculariae TaxID=2777116 RepID=A0A8S1HQY5_9PELO|nr:unnamed protein product [Caenorhabditis auriculariae]
MRRNEEDRSHDHYRHGYPRRRHNEGPRHSRPWEDRLRPIRQSNHFGLPNGQRARAGGNLPQQQVPVAQNQGPPLRERGQDRGPRHIEVMLERIVANQQELPPMPQDDVQVQRLINQAVREVNRPAIQRNRERPSEGIKMQTAIELDQREINCWDELESDMSSKNLRFGSSPPGEVDFPASNLDSVAGLRMWDQERTMAEARESLSPDSQNSPIDIRRLLERVEAHLNFSESDYLVITQTEKELQDRLDKLKKDLEKIDDLLLRIQSISIS